MEIWKAVILGIIQGITEWLPISSSGHLVLGEKVLGLEVPIIYDIILHIASLLVVLLVFWRPITQLVIGLLKGERRHYMYLLYIVIATIPIALIGVFFNDLIKSIFKSLYTVGGSLIFTGFILLLTKGRKGNKDIDTRSSAGIGLMQALAILPGISRSGMTISAGLLMGRRREEVARFSFIIFIPAILGALVFEAREMTAISQPIPLIVGFIVTFVIGYASLKLLLRIIRNDKFYLFGYYCLLLGLVVLGFAFL